MSLVDTLKTGVEKKSLVKYGKQSIDLQTASLLLSVFNWLSEANRAKFLRLGDTNLPFLIKWCWEHAGGFE